MGFITKWLLVITMSGSAVPSGTYDSELECKSAAASYGPMAYCVQLK